MNDKPLKHLETKKNNETQAIMSLFDQAEKEILEYLTQTYISHSSLKTYKADFSLIQTYNVWNKDGKCFCLCFIIELNNSKCGYLWTVFGDMFDYN